MVSIMGLQEKRIKLLGQLVGMPRLLNLPQIKDALEELPQLYGNEIVRSELDALRKRILIAEETEIDEIEIQPEKLAERIAVKLRRKAKPSVYDAINAAGIILHTALGRAPLAEEARQAVASAATGYSTLAIDRDSGKRGDRHKHAEDLLCFLTGAEGAVVVNNNAAATVVLLNSMAAGKEVIVSRGQLVEIGGAFRIPDVMMRSNAIMVEVGTTNKTHAKDYIDAVTEESALLLRVHASNYLITGFTSDVSVKEMAEIAHERGLVMADDIGSGCLYDTTKYGLAPEPQVGDSIRDGADLVCFSGDKMLGGPQCGIIVGKREVINKIKKNPLVRAFRCGKLTYSALEATLKLYLDEETLPQKLPILRMLTRSPQEIGGKERSFLRKVKPFLEGKCGAEIVSGFSLMGSGSLPSRDIPTKIIMLRPRDMTVECLSAKLRENDPPIFARIEKDAVILDFRTVYPREIPPMIAAMERIFG